MNRQVRYLSLGFQLLLISHPVHASNLLTFTGMCAVRTLGDISMLPVAFGGKPITPLQKLLHDNFGPEKVSKKKARRKQQALLPQSAQRIISANSGGQSEDGQTVELVDVPQVIHATLANIEKEADCPIYLNLNLNNHQTASTASTKEQLAPTSAPPTAPEPSWFSRSKEYLKKRYLSISGWISNHKLKASFLCAGGAIAGIHGYAWYLSRILSQPDCWSFWHAHCSLSSLYQIDQEELIEGLLQDLSQRYSGDNSATNMQRFIDEAQRELSLLNRYLIITSCAQQWPLKYLMFINCSLRDMVHDRIARLTFLQNTALGWLRTAHYAVLTKKTSSKKRKVKP